MAVEVRETTPPPLADATGRVVECTLSIVQQELELARIEVVEKLPATGRALVRLVMAAVIVVLGGILVVMAVVWALAEYVFGFQDVWASFALVAALLLAIGGYLGAGALRRARTTGPPLPTAAIRQAQALRESIRP